MTNQLRPQSRYLLRAIWAEAELLILGKLRLGLHPEQLERELYKNLQLLHDSDDDHRVLFRSICQRILNNLECKDLFKKLPPTEVYDELVGVPDWKAKFEIMMYHWFEDQEMLEENAMDDEIEVDMAEDEPLDSSCLKIVMAMDKKVTKDVQANYASNCKFLKENPSHTFVATTSDDLFMYGAVQKAWEGQGNRPRQYNLPTRPYFPPLQTRSQGTAAILGVKPGTPSSVSAGSISEDLTAIKSTPKTCERSDSSKALMTPQSILPHTPENETEFPTYRMEHRGSAFFARTISLGSPEKPKYPRPRPQGFTAVRIPKRANIEPGYISLDTYFGAVETIPKPTPMQTPDSAKDFGGSDSERACQTLEECMEWADDILRKYSGSGRKVGNEQDGAEDEDSDTRRW
ncbi:hypothetical protein ACEPPN_005435 [Leptodophora sp. 'Broadleaf-Isolate-01']